jgi:sugar/nucleoside kinase (ribokinase family)
MDLYSNDVGVAFVDIKSFAAYVGLGNACGAMVASRHGCSISISFWEETMAFVRGQGGF